MWVAFQILITIFRLRNQNMGNLNFPNACNVSSRKQESEIEYHDDGANVNLERQLCAEFANLNFLKQRSMKNSIFQAEKNTAKIESKYPEINKTDSLYSVEMGLCVCESIAIDHRPEILDFDEDIFKSVQHRIRDYVAVKKQNVRDFYEMGRAIAKTSKCQIYEARMLQNSQKARAIKIISLKLKQQKKSSPLKVISDILNSIAVLDHPNIARLYQIYLYKSQICMVYELLEGTLFDFVEAKMNTKYRTLEYEDQVKIIAQEILRSLCYLHRKNVAHLNINLKNILLVNMKPKTKDEVIAKLIGFSRIKTEVEENLQSFLTVQENQQTFLVAPEKLNNSYGLKTDIWDLGIALFEAITGKNLKNSATEVQNLNTQEFFILIWKQFKESYGYVNQHFFDLILKMIEPNYSARFTAKQCLDHPWFITEAFSCGSINFVQLKPESKVDNLSDIVSNMLLYQNANQEQLHEVAKIFYKLDLDHNGSIQFEQLFEYLKGNNQYQNNSGVLDDCFQIFKKVDHDESGTLEFHEFTSMICKKVKFMKKAMINEIFNRFDQNNDGIITVEELQSVMNGCEISEIQHHMKSLDPKFVGNVTRADFINYFLEKYSNKSEQSLLLSANEPVRKKPLPYKGKYRTQKSSFFQNE